MAEECWFCHWKRCKCSKVVEEPDPEDRELTFHERLMLAEEFWALSADGELPEENDEV